VSQSSCRDENQPRPLMDLTRLNYRARRPSSAIRYSARGARASAHGDPLESNEPGEGGRPAPPFPERTHATAVDNCAPRLEHIVSIYRPGCRKSESGREKDVRGMCVGRSGVAIMKRRALLPATFSSGVYIRRFLVPPFAREGGLPGNGRSEDYQSNRMFAAKGLSRLAFSLSLSLSLSGF